MSAAGMGAAEYVQCHDVVPAVDGIFVPGKAEHGFADSIIVSDAIYKANLVLSVMGASRVFHLRLGRVRLRGPGWKMATVEVRVAH
jgi:hypothetical protein